MSGARLDSNSISWCSPLWLTEKAREVFGGGIGLDPCANKGSIPRVKALESLTLPHDNGLTAPWHQHTDGSTVSSVWVNPPFGKYYMSAYGEILLPKDMQARRDAIVEEGVAVADRVRGLKEQFPAYSISDWRKRCADTWKNFGVPVITIGPANVDVSGWHTYIEKEASAILYLKGRVYFELVDSDAEPIDGLYPVIATGPAPMPCAVAYYGDDPDTFAHVYAEVGAIHILRG